MGQSLSTLTTDVVTHTEKPRNINVLREMKRDVVSSALRPSRRVKAATGGILCITHRAEEKVLHRAFYSDQG